jgi:hypothetical protein
MKVIAIIGPLVYDRAQQHVIERVMDRLRSLGLKHGSAPHGA